VDAKINKAIALMHQCGYEEVSTSSAEDVANLETFEPCKQLHSITLSLKLMEMFQ
jgi:hypothetical protein